MNRKIKICLVGHRTDHWSVVDAYLRAQSWFEITNSFIEAGQPLIWPQVDDPVRPDIVIVDLTGADQQTIFNLAAINRAQFELIVVGPANDAQLMRQAIKAGARDYVAQPLSKEELSESLRAIAREKFSTQGDGVNNVTTVINAKGGSGASFVAANLAHLMAIQDKIQTVLVDFDYQFGVQAMNFDVTVNHGLKEILETVGRLDAVALKGYLTQHASGLYLLGEKLDPVILSSELNLNAVDKLFDLINQGFDHALVDLPRLVDPFFSSVILRSSHVVLVMQQSIPHVRDTKRLLGILRQEFDMAPERITVVVNRFNKKSQITEAEIVSTLNHTPLVLLPNDYERVESSLNTATQMFNVAPTAPLTKALISMSQRVRGHTDNPKTLLKRAFSGLFGG